MMTLLAFLIAAAVLTAEGMLLCALLLRTRGERLLCVLLGYPLGVLLNALVFFALAFTVGLSLLTVGIAHLMLLIALFLLYRRVHVTDTLTLAQEHPLHLPRFVRVLCVIAIAAVLLPAILHALTIPSFYWDSFTNWAMRARLSFEAGTFPLDNVVQPQYPILLHAVQMLPMYLVGWTDRLANTMTLLLSLTGLASLFVLFKRHLSHDGALLLLTVILTVPLVSIHLRQGYADIHWAVFLLLSALTLHLALHRDRRLLLLSALFCAAASWTKLEGIYFGMLPWLVAAGIGGWHLRQSKTIFKHGILPLLILAAIWPAFVLLQGMRLSPHDTQVALHPEAIKLLLSHLFIMGTFGVHAWLIVFLLLILIARHRLQIFKLLAANPILIMGLLGVGGVCITYLATSEVRGLLKGDNFSRAMLAPFLVLGMGAGMQMRWSSHLPAQ